MTLDLQMQIFGQVLLTAFLSAMIGLDRERRDKSAGLRTHMLAGIGACAFAAIGLHAFPDNADSSRVAAAVASGIGFLGAGVIFQGKDRVRDLTTAASIWVTASVGVVVGTGAWFLGVAMTVSIWITLAILHRFGKRIPANQGKS
ncbi:MAG: MgtC/SapB family protein [Anaerolineae bacterium]